MRPSTDGVLHSRELKHIEKLVSLVVEQPYELAGMSSILIQYFDT
jgi:hypothetical protein